MYRYRFLCGHVFNSLIFIPVNRISRSCGNYIFKLIKNCQSVIQSGYTILHFYWCCRGFQFYYIFTILVTICFLNDHPSEYDGEGDGTSLQYSCLENPMDGGAW